jgi:hypothetical protein
MSSILDALRKVEREKAETAQPIEMDFDEDAAERDLIGGTDARGHMVLRLSPLALMASGGVVVLLVVATAGIAWIWMHGSSAPQAPVAVASYTPPPAPKAVEPAPAPQPPAPPVVAPEEKKPEPEIVAKALSPEPVRPEPVAKEEPPAPPAPKEVREEKPVKEPEPLAKAVKEKQELEPEKPVAKEPKPEEAAAKTPEPKPEAVGKKPEPKPEPVVVAKQEPAPQPLPEVAKAPAVEPKQPTIGEPLKSLPPAPVVTAAAPAPAADPNDVSSLLPPTEEDRRTIKVNMPRPANKRNPYDSAIINLQPVFLNELIPNTNAKLVGVRPDGVIVMKQDTGTRHFIPF